MSSEASASISEKAFLTILLHAAKYPAAAVNGILLGQADASKGTLQITAAVPLLHSFLTLAPSLETALFLVQMLAPANIRDHHLQVTTCIPTAALCRLTPTLASLPQTSALWDTTTQMRGSQTQS